MIPFKKEGNSFSNSIRRQIIKWITNFLIKVGIKGGIKPDKCALARLVQAPFGQLSSEVLQPRGKVSKTILIEIWFKSKDIHDTKKIPVTFINYNKTIIIQKEISRR